MHAYQPLLTIATVMIWDHVSPVRMMNTARALFPVLSKCIRSVLGKLFANRDVPMRAKTRMKINSRRQSSPACWATVSYSNSTIFSRGGQRRIRRRVRKTRRMRNVVKETEPRLPWSSSGMLASTQKASNRFHPLETYFRKPKAPRRRTSSQMKMIVHTRFVARIQSSIHSGWLKCTTAKATTFTTVVRVIKLINSVLVTSFCSTL
mmetsp:Transcript_59184/g.105614  ORF Transcript_59184/g.105614 Transcript_59184/m.105614 type:complete len:206 (+) Transcript_59184:2476-3093(+)